MAGNRRDSTHERRGNADNGRGNADDAMASPAGGEQSAATAR